MQHVEHIGIAVGDIEAAQSCFEQLLNRPAEKSEFVSGESVTTVFFKSGETKIELLSSSEQGSAISRFLTKRGQGIHHIALSVKDINREMARLKASGFELLNDIPKKGADNKLVCFLHPRTTFGVLVELCQDV